MGNMPLYVTVIVFVSVIITGYALGYSFTGSNKEKKEEIV